MIESRVAPPTAADHGVSVARDAGGKFGESPYARRESMNIKLYKTDLRPELNEVFDDITLFLNDLQPKHQWANVKYTKPELDIMIKLPLDGTYNHLGQFDYCDLFDEQANRHYYYYILNTNWKAKQTLQLQLSMDTLNTFWQEIKATLGPNTHVTRRYFDRWKKVGTKAYPLIDKHPEDISSPPMVQIAKPKAIGSTDFWTLVYMTDYAPDDPDLQQQISLAGNPVSCYAVPSVAKLIKGGQRTIRVSPGDFEDGTVFAVDYSHNGGPVKLHWEGLYFGSMSSWDYTMSHNDDYMIAIVNNRAGAHRLDMYGYGTSGRFTQSLPYVDISNANAIYIQPSGTNKDTPYGDLKWDNPINFGNELVPFDVWFESNKTNSRLIKIIELPYAPFEVVYEDGNKMVIPNGWTVSTDGLLKLIDDGVDLKSSVASFENLAPEPFVIADVVNEQGIQKKANPEEYETKLWNSSYYSLKYIYDNQAKPIKLEEFEHLAVPDYSLNINFYPSTGMDNSMGFEFKSTEQLDMDFGDWLISNRTTEVPYYTNEYLNYLRYGKAVDERNRNLSVASTVVGGIGSTITTGASLAFALGSTSFATSGPILGAAVGIIGMGIAIGSSLAKANDQINSKIDQYTHQSSSVQASNDLSIFKKYGKNKLLQVEYQPVKELRDSIGRYFHLYGYSCDEYGVPNWNTRIWSEYYVMEPDFFMSYVGKDYEDDISARMKAGFRLLHRVNLSDRSGVYDFDSEYENFERSLIS